MLLLEYSVFQMHEEWAALLFVHGSFPCIPVIAPISIINLHSRLDGMVERLPDSARDEAKIRNLLVLTNPDDQLS